MNVAVGPALHSVKRLKKGVGSAIMVVDCWVAMYEEALRAA
jgi:hypothetical protein